MWLNLDSRWRRGLASLSEATSDAKITYSIDKILITTGKPNKEGLEYSRLESSVSSGIIGNWIWSGLSYLETCLWNKYARSKGVISDPNDQGT